MMSLTLRKDCNSGPRAQNNNRSLKLRPTSLTLRLEFSG